MEVHSYAHLASAENVWDDHTMVHSMALDLHQEMTTHRHSALQRLRDTPAVG